MTPLQCLGAYRKPSGMVEQLEAARVPGHSVGGPGGSGIWATR